MYLVLLLLLGCLFMYTRTDNWLSDAYSLYNYQVYPFHDKISREERRYVNSIIKNYEYSKEFTNTYSISPYSFSMSIEKESGKTNLTRVNLGSTERNIGGCVTRLLRHIGINDMLCIPGYKYYGVGWDLEESIIKIYTLRYDKIKIECYVYTVLRNDENEIIETTFDTKKIYDVGEKVTVMHKSGKNVEQINLSRPGSIDTKNTIANKWIKTMQDLGFIFDTYSDYDGKVNLYFD